MSKKILATGLLLLSSSLLSGCFHKPADKRDPYENFNRSMFALNMDLDHLFMRPVAKTYNYLTPYFVQKGVKNAFDNLDEITSIPNDALQGKFLFMLNDFWRFLINTTAGVGGLFDVAKHMGLRPHYESFGMTLAYWQGDTHASPYLVLPFMGPGSFRSYFGKAVDLPTTPYFYIPGKYWYIDVGMRGLQAVNHRAELLPANRLIDTAFDPYVFVRSAYTQTMDKRLKDNQQETFKSKTIVSSNTMTVQDYQNTENGGSADNTAHTTGASEQHESNEGYIFDDSPIHDETPKTAEPATTPVDKKSDQKEAKPIPRP